PAPTAGTAQVLVPASTPTPHAALHAAATPSAPAAGAQPAAEIGPAPPPEPVKDELEEDYNLITSPIVGTFYRSPSPTADPFVKVGSQVEPDTVVCIIEAMKLMNEIQAETRGTIAKILVENGQPVEYGQPLFAVKK
ncbi:MAG TPA: acetyl-CoA carboxylase biotin carboxyl carrier protein, partial [Pyrinomonadaceae bacterium]|nr:acetyl-CoA carboxylase biotin carboxyl carrier protein [Pyrinomonadaceae bacterium]